jgi:hypothetical protein
MALETLNKVLVPRAPLKAHMRLEVEEQLHSSLLAMCSTV